MGIMRTVISTDGTKIAYETIGKGPTVILILGALNSRKSGSKLAKLLASNFTVVSYDRRGKGDSTDTTPYSPQREIEDLEALIEAVGGSVYLYGHSSGAAIAIQAASKMPEKVMKLAIYEAPYSLGNEACKAAREYDAQLKELLKAGRSGDAVALFIKAVGVSEKQIQAMKRMPIWKGLEAMAPTLSYESEVMGEGHTLPLSLLKFIKTPTLVMHGGAGAPSMAEVAQAISENIQNAQLCTLTGQTHGVKPKVLAPVLTEFFS